VSNAKLQRAAEQLSIRISARLQACHKSLIVRPALAAANGDSDFFSKLLEPLLSANYQLLASLFPLLFVRQRSIDVEHPFG
jgi:hypothetical protein